MSLISSKPCAGQPRESALAASRQRDTLTRYGHHRHAGPLQGYLDRSCPPPRTTTGPYRERERERETEREKERASTAPPLAQSRHSRWLGLAARGRSICPGGYAMLGLDLWYVGRKCYARHTTNEIACECGRVFSLPKLNGRPARGGRRAAGPRVALTRTWCSHSGFGFRVSGFWFRF